MSKVATGVMVVVCLAGALTGCGKPPRAAVETFDASVRVRTDGGADIRETLTLLSAPTATTFERVVTFTRADGLWFLSASLDGREITRETSAGSPIAFSDGKALRVRYTFPAAVDARRTLTLVYQAKNVVEISGRRGRVRLTLLDKARNFDVGQARLAILPPAGVGLLDQSGLSEAGWNVAHLDGGIAGERAKLAADESASVDAQLPIEPSEMGDPVWQLNAERVDQFALAFISGGLFILVVGVGVIWIVRFEHPRRRTDDEEERKVVRRGLKLGGLACVALSGAAYAVAVLALSQFGIWPLAMPASILIVGLLLVAVSSWIV